MCAISLQWLHVYPSQLLTWWRIPSWFYINHPDDCRYNAINQHYKMECHTEASLYQVDHTASYYLVKPTSESKRYAQSKGLCPHRQWFYAHHNDTFIHGPFNFRINQNRRQSRDRVEHKYWFILYDMKHTYKNEAPTLSHTLGTVSIHYSTLFHTEMESLEVDKRVFSAPMIFIAFYSNSTS